MDGKTGLLAALAQSEDVEADIERMEPLAPEAFEPGEADEFAAVGPTGHGLMSWRFRVRVRTASLDLDFVLPCLQALADDETRRKQAEDVKAVCKLAATAMLLARKGRLKGHRVVASCEPETGCLWRTEDAAGNDGRSGEDWTSLVDLLVGFTDVPSDGSEPSVRIEG